MSAVTRLTGGTSRFGQALVSAAPLAGVVVILAVAAVATPDFYSRANLDLVLFQAGVIGVTAVGQTLVLIGGGIDLSIGAVIGLTTVIVATHTDGADGRLATAVLLAALAGVAVGAVNAGLVLLRQVPPFVATFATFVLVQGVITAWTKGAPSGQIPDGLRDLGAGEFAGMPIPLWIFAGVALVGGLILARTSAGRRLYASGATRRAADLSGIRTGWVLAATYVVAAVLAVLAGLIYAGYVGHVDAELSRSLDLDSVAAAVIGGVALTGGRGTIVNTVAGVALLSILLVWVVQFDAGIGAELVVEGGVILLAALLHQQGGRVRFTQRERH